MSQSDAVEHDPMSVVFASFLSTRRIAALMGVVLVGFVLASDASAQRRSQWQFQPSSPTLSPYLNLLQTNFGPVPNYYSLVRPQLSQQAFNRQVEANQRSQTLRIQALTEEGAPAAPITRTGKAGGFMEYLHYYPPRQTPTRQR
jgi:hypothetical protein